MNNFNFTSLYDLNGKNALVTGGGGLLAKQHALALSQLGAKVFLCDLNLESATKNSEEINKDLNMDVVFPINMDVTKEDSIKKTIEIINSKYGNIDILINNAAINPQMSSKKNVSPKDDYLENFPLEIWNSHINVGLTGAFLCSRHIGKKMSNNSGGIILNIASDLSVISPDHRIYGLTKDGKRIVKPVAYSVVKAGIVGLTKYLSTYWADKGVRSNSLSPGGVYTNQEDDFVQKISKLIPFGRMAGQSEYIGAIQFLCSDASKYLNGQNIIMDGGRSVW